MRTSTRLLGWLLFLVLSGSLTAQAKAPRCESIFFPTVRDVLEQVDKDNNLFLFKGTSSEAYIKDFSWIRKRKIRKILENTDIQTLTSEKAVERYAIELGSVLFGKTDSILRWTKNPKETRLEESTVILIKEKLLQDGLVQTWSTIRDPRDVTAFRKGLDKVAAFTHSKTFELLRFPFALPSLKNSEIPPALMFKIVRDGFKAHAEEARIALKSQTKIDAYNTFRKVYSSVFFSIVMIFNIQTGYEQMTALHQQQVDTVIHQIKESRNIMESMVEQLKKEQFEEAYRGAEADFIQKWGEPPTAAEKQILRAKIAEALHYTPESASH
ncbi:hypothetical protein [Bdellovibrio bacteriovorus]|uniref:hypothetical protein n=1 Tax=Bdellovibrio bacteriovorus TaxID=959 RepID=UPI0035A5CAE0